jgi:hypothetical protein
MNRLQAELQRLYLWNEGERPAPDADEPGLIGPDGRVRAMVLELARPASWEGLAKVWRGVQADLGLPAPAIAVSGFDGYQLWFSLAQPVPAAQAMAFLESLRRRYLGDVVQDRIGMKPSVDASAPRQARHAGVLPPAEGSPGRWSAFVAPDLAALFADEPWLDLPPGSDAQAELLSRLKSMKPEDLQRASERLLSASTPGSAPAAPAANSPDPRRFLLEVMNDPAIELHLRIEAAKALLPSFEGQRLP